MDWINSHGMLLLVGVLFLFFGLAWLVTWFGAQRKRLEAQVALYKKELDDAAENAIKEVHDNSEAEQIRKLASCLNRILPHLETKNNRKFIFDQKRLNMEVK